jgi:hypothetical protein
MARKDGCQMSVLLDYLQSSTAVPGWCSEAEVLLETDRLKPNVTLSDANPQTCQLAAGWSESQLVAQSVSPLALGGQLKFTFVRCINTIQFSPSNAYLIYFLNSARQHIVLCVVKAKGACLVSSLSTLHRILLVWSKEFTRS